jgi:putative ABC transport system substrate-binding protein
LLATGPLPPGVLDSFREEFLHRGYVEGQNLSLDVRWPRGSFEQDPNLAADMARSGVDVIVAWATPAALAAQRATSIVPIVVVSVGDPVGAGLVTSLTQPGGNITGFSNQDADSGAKGADLFVQMVPDSKRVGIVLNPSNLSSVAQLPAAQEAMSQLDVASQVAEAASAVELKDVLSRLSQAAVDGVIFMVDPSTIEHRKLIAEEALVHRLPTMFQSRDNVEGGGLMSYGANLSALFRQATLYVEDILKGAEPAELPVVQPKSFELILNRKTAKSLGLTIPASILARADKVIE